MAYYKAIMVEKFIIEGGKKLDGVIKVRGAKNSVGNLFMATLLTDEPCVLTNVPNNKETDIVAELAGHIGSEILREGNTVRIHTPEIKNFRVSELSRKNRIPILALGPLLLRTREAEVPLVGGDKIGARPVDFHIGALKKLGAEITVTDSAYFAKTKGLKGAAITLPYPSVGATKNILLSSVLAEGKTSIINAAIEPEITDLIRMLQDMGALIEVDVNRMITIEGVPKLRGVKHTLIPDRLEAASFAVMAIATNGNILVQDAVQDNLAPFLNAIRKIGGEYSIEETGIRFYRKDSGRPNLLSIHIETDTYPGFVTDWQQPFAV
ncbi:MAG: UDP-N-acetylglucosamine 1-carboxyvinyltransferase, partial [Candidatus Sungbacteria bacterium]|nr:UDP-N-acetylglucosamine 1-carboxyvinyltransferase [Candidatus Sungbacteria bacterium]